MIKNLIKSFSIDDIDIVETENSSKYFEAEMWCLAAKNNSHKNPISEDVLRQCKDTAKGAWVVCDYDQFTHDATTHTDEEQIVGVVPRDSRVELRRDKEGVLWIVVTAVLSKVYHPEVWEMFKQHNFRYVSCEFRCTEADEDAEGNKPITAFDIVGITILGSGTLPSCEDAKMEIMKFSADEANKYFAETQKKEELVSHPINKKKLDTSDWDGEKAKQDLIKERNYESLAKSVCLVLEDGWKDRQITSLKYPVMNIKDGEWVYNEKGLASALGYAKQHDPSLVSKIEKIQSEFNRKENEMADIKDKNTKPTGDVKDDDAKKNASTDPKADDTTVKKNSDDSTDPKKDDDASKGTEPKNDDKKLSDDDTKKKDDDKKDTKVKASDDSNDKKDIDNKTDTDDKKDDDSDDKKKFSLDCYADEGALLSMLENETEENQTLCKELFAKKDLNVIMSKLLAIKKENDEFKKNAQEVEAKECSEEFSACMGEVKGDIDEKTYSELYAEGKDIKSKDEMCKFTQKVKAFAYDHKKTNSANDAHNDGVFRFSAPSKTDTVDDTDVFARLNKKYN